MSHIATVQTQIKDLDALRAALTAMGLTLLDASKTPVRYYGGAVDADYVVGGLKGRYDLGFKRQADGAYSFVCDSECMADFDNGRNNEFRETFGPQGGKLVQQYVGHALQNVAPGFTMHTQTNDDGSVTYDLVQYN